MLLCFCVFKKKVNKIPFYSWDFKMCLWYKVCFLCVRVWSFHIAKHPVCCCYALWKAASLSPLLAQLSHVLWSGLAFVFSSSNAVCEASFLLTAVIHQLSLLLGKSVALISPVIRPVTEKVELDECLPVASKHLFIEIWVVLNFFFFVLDKSKTPKMKEGHSMRPSMQVVLLYKFYTGLNLESKWQRQRSS